MSAFTDHCGIRTDDAATRLQTDERHENAGGTVHGGLLVTMLDSAMGSAVADVLDQGQKTATVDLSVTFLEPGSVGDALVARARIVRRATNLVFTEASVAAEGSADPVARAIATFAVIDAE